MAISLLATSYAHSISPLCALVFHSNREMESAIKTLVTTYLSSSRGKENLDSKSFKKLVQKQLGGMMEVRACILFVDNRHMN